MKLIFNLSVVLLSTSCLFAQVDATHQVRGYKLQMPLQRQEMEDRRWKMAVEAQGCSFQNIEGRVMNENEYKDVDDQSSLLANNSVPIFHLPSSSSYLGVTPKLMMNPEEINKAEDVFGFLGRPLLSAKTAALTTIEGDSFTEGEKSISTAPAGQNSVEEDSCKIIAGEENVDRNTSGKNIPNFQEKIVAVTNQIEETKQALKGVGGKEKAYFWNRIVIKLEQARENWTKAYETFSQGKEERYLLWKKAAEESEASAHKIRKMVQDYIPVYQKAVRKYIENWNAGLLPWKDYSLSWKDYSLSDASTWLLKSEEALENSCLFDCKDRELWKNISDQYQVAAEYAQKAEKYHEAGRRIKEINWYWAGNSMYASAEYQVKAIEANKAEKIILTVGFREAAEISKNTAEQLAQGALTYNGVQASILNNVGMSLQSKADYQAKAGEAEELGEKELAESYRNAAVISQQSADHRKQVVSHYIKGYNYDIIIKEADSLQAIADYQIKACEAHKIGKLILAEGYQEAVEISQQAFSQHKIKYKHRHKVISVGIPLQAKAEYQVKAIEAEESGNLTLAANYREVMVILQQAADLWRLAAAADVAGKSKEGYILDSEGKSLQKMAKYHAKAIEAQEAGKERLATNYRKVTLMFQGALDQYKQSEHALTAGEEKDKDYCRAGDYLQYKAKRLRYQAEHKEYQEAVNKKKGEKEFQKNKIKVTTDNELISSTIKANENYHLDSSFQREKINNSIKMKALFVYCEKWLADTGGGQPCQILSDYLINVLSRGEEDEINDMVIKFEEYWDHIVKAHELGDDLLAVGWIQVAEDMQQAIEYSIKRMNSNEDDEDDEGEKDGIFDEDPDTDDVLNTGIFLMRSIASHREEYIEVAMPSQNPEVMRLWKKALKQEEFIVDCARKAAEARSLKNREEYKFLYYNILGFLASADRFYASLHGYYTYSNISTILSILKKSIEKSDEPEISKVLRELAEQYLFSYELYIKAIEERSKGNTEGFTDLKKAAEASREEARAKKNSINKSILKDLHLDSSF